MGKHAHRMDSKIRSRIKAHRKSSGFTSAYFDDLAGRATVSLVLKRHTDAATLRNLARGSDHRANDPSKLEQ